MSANTTPKTASPPTSTAPAGQSPASAAGIASVTSALVTLAIPAALAGDWPAGAVLVGGLAVFGVVFALNSSLHSFLIVAWAKQDGVSLDVGFYYMANAMGRLVGTVLSGWLYQVHGLSVCLWVSAALVAASALLALALPRQQQAA